MPERHVLDKLADINIHITFKNEAGSHFYSLPLETTGLHKFKCQLNASFDSSA
jgi:hypothetical protein